MERGSCSAWTYGAPACPLTHRTYTPGVAPTVVIVSMLTFVPWPIPGLTGFGAYVMGGDDVSSPITIGLAGSRVSARVLIVTTPVKDWLRDTLNALLTEVVPVVASETWLGTASANSGMTMV